MRTVLPRNRMASAAALAWLVCAFVLGWSPVALLAVAVSCVAVAVMGSCTQVAAAHAAAVCAACVAVVVVPLAARTQLARSSPLAVLARAGATADLEVVTTGDPAVLAAHGVARTARVAVPAKALAVTRAGRRVRVGGRVLVIAPSDRWSTLLPGQHVHLSAALAPGRSAGPSGVVAFARGDPTRIGQSPWWQRAAAHVRTSLRAAARGLPPGPRGLLPGLVDGDTSGLDPVIKAHFRVAGMTHLVAVSGTNLSVVAGAVLLTLRRTRTRPWQRAVLVGVVVVAFVVVARPSPSVLRAAAMAAVALVALATGRRRRGLAALGVAVVALLAHDPLLARDAGFAMSVLASAALLTLAPWLASALQRRHVPAPIAAVIAVSVSAHLVTAPVVAAISGRFSLVAVPANVLAEPVVAVTTVLGCLAALVAPVWLPAGGVVAQCAGWPCRWLILVADRFGGMPGATVPWPRSTRGALLLATLVVCVLLAVRHRRVRRLLAVAAVVAVSVQIPVRSVVASWPPPGWFFVACDVGQGDGLVLAAGPATAVVVDTGPDPVAMDRCLHDLGVQHVALLVLSHLHLDHVGGIDGVFRGRTVDRVATGSLDEPQSGLRLVDHALRTHAQTLGMLLPATSTDVGALHLEVVEAGVFHGTRSDPNNSSVVLRATVHGVRILLTGDVEVEAQQAVLDQGLDVRADILKVPHHGSAYSVPAFLAAVHASAAVISVGLHNDYGHPAASLLAMLQRLGLRTRRTDRDGDVAFAGAPGSVVSVARGPAASTVGGDAG